MSRRRQPMNQLTIPVGNEIGFKHDPDEAFEREYGTEKAQAQRDAYIAERACTCGSPWPNKWGAKWKHKAGCPRAGRKW